MSVTVIAVKFLLFEEKAELTLLPFCFQMHLDTIYFCRLILLYFVGIYAALVLPGVTWVWVAQSVLDTLSSVPLSWAHGLYCLVVYIHICLPHLIGISHSKHARHIKGIP